MGLKDLPLGGGERHARAFERLGWSRRETSASKNHIILTKSGVRATLSIPCHKGKDVKRTIIATLIKLAGISEADYKAKFK